jgi:hypothetical protein
MCTINHKPCKYCNENISLIEPNIKNTGIILLNLGNHHHYHYINYNNNLMIKYYYIQN